jgi:hypothetical protein
MQISINLNASTMMIADKASDLIRGRTWWSGRFTGQRHGLILAPLQPADGSRDCRLIGADRK